MLVCGYVGMVRDVCVFFSSRRRHTRCALVTGVQTCALPILFYPEFLASGVHPHIRMRTVAVHVAPGTRQAALAHHVGDLMRAFGIVGPEVPLHEIGRASCRERVCLYG